MARRSARSHAADREATGDMKAAKHLRESGSLLPLLPLPLELLYTYAYGKSPYQWQQWQSKAPSAAVSRASSPIHLLGFVEPKRPPDQLSEPN